MSEQDIAFDKWWNDETRDFDNYIHARHISYVAWTAATAESEKRIAALESEVAELARDRDEWKDSTISANSRFQIAENDVYKYQVKNANIELDIAQLQANINTLREALKLYKGVLIVANKFGKLSVANELIKIEEALAATLSESLQAHDDEVIEKCAKVATDACLVPPDGGTPMSYEVELCDAIAEAIRELKEVK